MQLKKRHHIDFSAFKETEGRISNVMDVHMKINKLKSYKVTIDIPFYEGESYQVTKEILVPMHMLHTIAVGKTVLIKVNPNKKEDVYIQNAYGIL